VVHELIHGLTWACFAKSGWKSISFGVMWKLLTPYCHCDEPMHIPGYMAGAMMPCFILGVIPAIVALFIGSLPMLAWGIFFIAAAAGDIWMTWLLTKENPKSFVLDHPSEAGFYIIDEEKKVLDSYETVCSKSRQELDVNNIKNIATYEEDSIRSSRTACTRFLQQ